MWYQFFSSSSGIQWLALSLLCFMTNGFAQNKLAPSIKVEQRIENNALKTQKRIDDLAQATMNMSLDYRAVLIDIKRAQIYNYQMEQNISRQEEEQKLKQEEINRIDKTERDLLPLMHSMVEALEKFIKFDLPFEQEERQRTLAEVKNMLQNPAFPVATQYGAILTAYQKEIAYGNSVDHYTGTVDISGIPKQVDFLRFGRVCLAYVLSGDTLKAAIWDKETGDWQKLDSKGARIVARTLKQVQANKKSLMTVPVMVSKEAN